MFKEQLKIAFFRDNVGSIQILTKLNEHVAAFEYGWIAYPEAANFGDKTWTPLHVSPLNLLKKTLDRYQ